MDTKVEAACLALEQFADGIQPHFSGFGTNTINQNIGWFAPAISDDPHELPSRMREYFCQPAALISLSEEDAVGFYRRSGSLLDRLDDALVFDFMRGISANIEIALTDCFAALNGRW